MKSPPSGKLYLFLAFILSGGYYALLGVSFNFEPETVQFEKRGYRPLADVTMLPIEKNPALTWQRNLIASLELLDPTIMSLPNISYGFSKIRSLEFERPLQPLSSFPVEVGYISVPQTSRIQFTPPILDLIYAINIGKSLEPNSSQRKVNDLLSPKKSQVFWTDGQGKAIATAAGR